MQRGQCLLCFDDRLFILRADRQKRERLRTAEHTAGEDPPGIIERVICNRTCDHIEAGQAVRIAVSVVKNVIKPRLIPLKTLYFQGVRVQLVNIYEGVDPGPVFGPAPRKFRIR